MARKKATLTEYRAKRDFSVTPEPAPEPASKRKAVEAAARVPTFMVHKHDATRLHYDLRLEMDGALASWAIPKGPSYDPAEKRLAVQTEDHPLEYGGFEGRIPDGEYGGGDSIIWERGVYETMPPGNGSAQRRKGHLFIVMAGEKLQGGWHLVRTQARGGKQQWLIFKAKDGTERPGYDVVAERPESVVSGRRVTRGPVTKKTLQAIHLGPEKLLLKVWPPMKATLSKRVEDAGEGFSFEVKYDGYRGLAALSGGKLAFQTRNAIDLTARFPEIAQALRRVVVGEAVIDGEIVAFDREGVSRFQQLLGPGVTHWFVAFDLLWLEGEDLRRRPLEERRELLGSLFANSGEPLMLAERIDKSAREALAEATERGLEGVIAKRVGSHYEGKRSNDWLKLKVSAGQEAAIVGYTPISNGADEVGALLLGVREGKDFVYAGRVGTGFTAKVRKALKARLDEDRVEKAFPKDAPRLRDAIWVKPALVAQVAFTEWTTDGKLRHPSFQGLRVDKRPEDCVREVPTAIGSRRAPMKLAAKRAKPRKTAAVKRKAPAKKRGR